MRRNLRRRLACRAISAQNRLVQRLRLRLWVDIQFVFQRLEAGFVLADGPRPIAHPSQQSHNSALGGFVERVERQPAAGIRQGRCGISGLGVALHEFFERAGQFTPEIFGLLALPVLEWGGIRHTETGQEVAAIEPNRA